MIGQKMNNKKFLLLVTLSLFIIIHITFLTTALETNQNGVGGSLGSEISATTEDIENFVEAVYSGKVGVISGVTKETVAGMKEEFLDTLKGLVDIMQGVAVTAAMHGQLTEELKETLKGEWEKITAAVWSVEHTKYGIISINGLDWFAVGDFTKEVAEKLGALVEDIVATKFSHLQTTKQKAQFAMKELRELQTKLSKIGMKGNVKNVEDAWGLEKVKADITKENMAAVKSLKEAIEKDPDSGLEVSLSSLAATAALQEFAGIENPTAAQIGVVDGVIGAGVKAGMSKEEITEATKGVTDIVDELAKEGNKNPTTQDVLDRAQEKADAAAAAAKAASDNLNDAVNGGYDPTGTEGDISNEGEGLSDSVGDG
jgi:hypothetical protein